MTVRTLDTKTRDPKSELLQEYKRELKTLNLTLTIIGENAESSKEIMRSRAMLMAKIEELEAELSKRSEY